MHHTSAMGVSERLAQLFSDLDGLLDGQAVAFRVPQQIGDRAAFYELADDVGPAPFFTYVMHRYDVRVVAEPAHHLSLTPKADHAVLIKVPRL